MRKKIIKGGIVEEFINWFHSRGEFYSKLSVKFYMDGEPYFESMGAECTLRDYLQVKEREKIKQKELSNELWSGLEKRIHRAANSKTNTQKFE